VNTVFIFILFFAIYFLLIYKAGKTNPILYLFVFTYFTQYVFSVYLIYNEYPVLSKQMPLSEGQLFDYVVPSLLFLFAGVFLFNKDVDISAHLKTINPREATRLGNFLLLISFSFDFLSYIGIPGINSLLSFTHYLKYAGAMCYIFAPSLINYTLLTIVLLALIRDALIIGIFIDFFMWSTHFFLLIALYFELSLFKRSSFILLAAPLLILIQSVKQEYREATWSGKKDTGLGLIAELADKEESSGETDPLKNSDGVVSTIGRLNQGWHLGKVLKRVPAKEPFSYGEDMLTDFEGILLPRIFFPDKKTIGSQDKFYKFTGHKLEKGTSMTIGVLGDFYINFGYWGSFIGLFIFGIAIAKVFSGFMTKYVLTNPVNVVWVPFLFSFLVRANNDFYIVVNNLFKGFIIFLFVNYILKKFWPSKRPALK
jgi:hypothetical protein